MEGKDPSFPFYAADWILETRRISVHAKDFLINFRCEVWINGPFRSDADGYPRGLSAEEKKLFEESKHLLTCKDGFWFYGADEEAREKRIKFRKLQTEKSELARQWRDKQKVNKKKPVKKNNKTYPASIPPDEISGIIPDIPADIPFLENENEYENEKINKKKGKGVGKGKPSVLFRDSPHFELSVFQLAFQGSKYAVADMEHYHEAAINWSDGKGNRRPDWIATVRSWMARDYNEGKLKLKSSANGTYHQISTGSNGLGTSGERIKRAQSW